MKKKTLSRQIKQYLPIYLMLLPGFVYLFINNYIPMGGLIIAFKHLNFAKGILGSDWIGFANFEYLFKSPDAFRITRNTIGYNFAFIFTNMVVGITFAILLSEIWSKRAIKIYQTILLLPFMLSMVIVSYLSYAFLAGDTGFLNSVLKLLGLKSISWYSEQIYWPFILLIINTWKTVGYSTVIYMASILGIDGELYEAAAVDGIKRLQKIRYITIPLIKPTIITLLLLQVGRMFYSDFGLFYQVPMSSGALMNVTNTIDTYVYRGLITLGDVAMTSAANFYQSFVGFILVMTVNWITKKYSRENALF